MKIMLYVPILKCKQGEKNALNNLEEDVKDLILPLLEVTPDVIERDNFQGVEDFWENRQYIFDISPEYYEKLTESKYKNLLSNCSREFTLPTIRLADSLENTIK